MLELRHQIQKQNQEFMKLSAELNQKRMADSDEDDKKSEGELLDQISDLNKQVHKKDEKIMDIQEKYDDLRESNKQLKLEIKKLTK